MRPYPRSRYHDTFRYGPWLALAFVLAIVGIGAEVYAWHVIATVGVEHAPWWVLFLAFGGR